MEIDSGGKVPLKVAVTTSYHKVGRESIKKNSRDLRTEIKKLSQGYGGCRRLSVGTVSYSRSCHLKEILFQVLLDTRCQTGREGFSIVNMGLT